MKKPETGKDNNQADNDHGHNGRRTIHSEIIRENRQNLIGVSVIKRFWGIFHFLLSLVIYGNRLKQSKLKINI
jgi:hypothetical protein